MITKIFTFITKLISSLPFILTIECLSFTLKTCLLVLVISHGLRSPKIKRPWFLLLLILIGSSLSNFAWILYSLRQLFIPNMDYRFILFWARLAWGFSVILYQSLALFIDSLTEKNHKLKIYQKLYLFISSILCLPWFYFALFEFNNFSHDQRPLIELKLLKISSIYIFFIIIPSLIASYYKIRGTTLPKILKKQLKILIPIIICPYILSDFIQTYPFSFYTSYIASNFSVVGISSALLTYAIYYSARKMIGLRFLNFHSHVRSLDKFNFIDDFREVLSQLSLVTNVKELGHITQTFFKDAFNVPPSRTRLHLRNFDQNEPAELTSSPQTIVENFIGRHDNQGCAVAEYIEKLHILIYDEMAFSNFYNETNIRTEILHFMDQLNADIFIPIYEKHTIIGYIIIERDARLNEVYSDVERDEMVVFASYLANNINLQQSQNIKSIIHREKEVREELFRKHQEINQYKESIRSFMRSSDQRKIGVLFYKNRKFTFGNKAASELIQINPNKQEGHPIAKSLKSLAQQVQDYKSPQSIFAKDGKGTKLVLSALPSLEQNAIIITVSYPEISDVIKKQIDLLTNPSEWDYLLYLETTKSGQLINQLIPGSGEQLLNFKIELLKTALTKKALLLEMQEEDLIPTVEILHHVSLRENLHILKLHTEEKNYDTAIKLFGINPIFGKVSGQPLLEKADNGTLFIQNIHYLNRETQEHLAELITYGYYHVFKSDKKISNNTRIICSTDQNLQTLVQEGKFSKALFNELKQTTLSMPSLVNLSQNELSELVEGFTEQAVASQPLKNLLELTDREKTKLINRRPVSLHEFKDKIQQLLQQKSKKNNIFEEQQFDPAYEITDPDLIEAARLGKKALKDPKIMALLWNKFKNQNHIARFLRVNRSSVSRRCREYNLE